MGFSCVSPKVIPITSFSEREITHPDSILIFIKAHDLSEDFGITSTKDDELVLLIYSNKNPLSAPLVFKEFIATQNKNEFTFKAKKSLLSKREEYLLALLEVDSENSKDSIELLFRNNQDSLIHAHHHLNYTTIQDILGDDDLLGAETFSLNPDTSFSFQGYNLADKYHYSFYIDLP